MKNLLSFFIALFILPTIVLISRFVSVYADIDEDKEIKERLECDAVGCHAYKVWVDNHVYIVFSKGVVHDPDCKCQEENHE